MRLTFDEAVKDVVADYAVNGKRSKAELNRRVRLHLTPYFGGRRLSAITTADVRASTAPRLEAKASAAEINRELAIVRRAFRLAVKADRYYGRVPSFEMLTEENVRTGFFDEAMINTVIEHLPSALRAVVRFAYITGWHVQSEILPRVAPGGSQGAYDAAESGHDEEQERTLAGLRGLSRPLHAVR